ncbi:probable serine/threonine-protein kinase dyrk2 isoform X1 [Drosophila montana]|uniref:probable serine/threonine-protein kinase dyrk2 isoform X1 n=1 Tax=Drosophila montana TaxID=40370 RepID=UPI00313C3C90
MTFYWWSHWFWITTLSVLLVPITHVHTYPSHEINPESTTQQEERLVEQTEAAGHETNGRRHTTKLYQTTSSQTWATVTQRNIMDLTIKTTAASRTTAAYTDVSQQESVDDEVEAPFSDAIDDDDDDVAVDDDDGNGNGNENEDIDDDNEHDEATVKLTLSHNQFEFKRSADFAGAAIVPSEQLNNYTNFSRSTSTNTNNSSSSSSSSVCNSTCLAAAAKTSSQAVNTTTATPATPATTTTTTSSTIPTTTTTSPPTNSTGPAAPATPSTPKINTEWLSDELQRVPFTLENANKEDELRRAESEHRSRKSKVLSAEYKHINRYINFSSDTKSLLTRSASAAPSVSGYEADESNISSEALAIQRTYFLDAGAISAICFTVFGICCTVGTIGIVLYRRRYLNKPQALSEPDSSVYIDDSTMRVSDNSDEMYSLDNDSFLNSLEAMTIQNYWTDTVKHTKL